MTSTSTRWSCLKVSWLEYDGTLLLASHDRAFLDGVVTSIYAFEGNGRVREYVGGYSDWRHAQSTTLNSRTAPSPTSPSQKAAPGSYLPGAA